MTDAERLQALRAEILRHDRLYYVEARPEISDRDYDALWDELVALERAHPELVTPDSPTQRVGGQPLEGFAKVRHDPPMQSLDKTYAKGDLLQFDAFLRQQLPDAAWDYVVEPKVDGVSLSLLYRRSTNGLTDFMTVIINSVYSMRHMVMLKVLSVFVALLEDQENVLPKETAEAIILTIVLLF